MITRQAGPTGHSFGIIGSEPSPLLRGKIVIFNKTQHRGGICADVTAGGSVNFLPAVQISPFSLIFVFFLTKTVEIR